MIDKLIKGIASDIKKEFENTVVYTEKVKQGFKEPCFSLECVKSGIQLFRDERYRMTCEIHLHYYDNRKRESYTDMACSLFGILNYTVAEGMTIRPISIEMNSEEDYCLFKLKYDFFCFIDNKDENVLMQEVTIKNKY